MPALVFGRLSEAQQAVLARHVRGRRVHDLGAGDLSLSRLLLRLGAHQVVAIDHVKSGSCDESQLEFVETEFEDYKSPIEVAFISWPANWDMGLHILVETTPLVIYLGKNTDGSCCGYAALWRELTRREVLDESHDRANNLLIYGPQRVSRPRRPEEVVAVDSERVWGYDELYKLGPTS